MRPSLIPTMLVWMEYPTNKPSRTGRYLCANTISYTPSFFIRFWNQEHQEWTSTVTNEDIEYWADVDTYEIKALGDY